MLAKLGECGCQNSDDAIWAIDVASLLDRDFVFYSSNSDKKNVLAILLEML
jgi:hypothetical protein